MSTRPLVRGRQVDVAEDAKRLIFRARLAEEAVWKQRARVEGLTFSEWVRRQLNAAVGNEPAILAAKRSVRVPPEERRLEGEPPPAPTTVTARCLADTGYGVVCRVCGKVHK